MLFAGLDKNGPQLYHMDPSGTYLQFGAKAIGSGSEGAQQSLQESYHKVRNPFLKVFVFIFVILLAFWLNLKDCPFNLKNASEYTEWLHQLLIHGFIGVFMDSGTFSSFSCHKVFYCKLLRELKPLAHSIIMTNPHLGLVSFCKQKENIYLKVAKEKLRYLQINFFSL